MPIRIYRYDFDTNRLHLWKKAEVAMDPDDFEVKQVVYASRDGTPVTMFLAHKKGIELKGGNPTLLYGYGGFNASQTPGYSTRNVVWMEMGGVYALANLRGGGERGRDWYEGGVREKKQNVFDDFIAAAESLIYNGYTSKRKLAIAGASNGGLLVPVRQDPGWRFHEAASRDYIHRYTSVSLDPLGEDAEADLR